MFVYKVVVESKKYAMELAKQRENNQESIVDILNQDVKEPCTDGPIHFSSGNPTIENIEGKIHLFKLKNKSTEFQNNNTPKYVLPEGRGKLLCVLAVPSYMSISDFAKFTADFHKSITNIRVLRDTHPGRYMALINLNSQDAADEFFTQFNGKPFNSMSCELCTVVFVENVEFIQPTDATIFPTSAQAEIPSCPVCLERLDEGTTGILTMMCNHSLHSQCLSKWRIDKAACPVCRYSQTSDESPTCSVCGTTESLWICLLCGNVGCGRYLNEHARQHFKETNHAYAMELQTSRVWDYAGDGYVHRLVQNKADGKLVELRATDSDDTSSPWNKLESVSLEYSYLLEAQRLYFEDQIRRLEMEKQRKMKHLEEEYAQLFQMNADMELKLQEMCEEKKKWDKKFLALEKRIQQTKQEADFLKNINDALKQNQEQWKEKIQETATEKKMSDDSKDKKIKELEEQIQDLMFFIEAKQKISNNTELQEGQVVMVPTNNNQTPTKGASPSKRTKKTK